jgi:hypothetical protein
MTHNISQSHILCRIKISQKINQRVYVRRGMVMQRLLVDAIKTFNLDDLFEYTFFHRERHRPISVIAKVEELKTSDADGEQTPIQLDLERLSARAKIQREKPPILRLEDREVELRYSETQIGRTHIDSPKHATDIDLAGIEGGLTVSRSHAVIKEVGRDYQIQSAEQVSKKELEIEVNGRLIHGVQKLTDGDRITLGAVTLTFVLPEITR